MVLRNCYYFVSVWFKLFSVQKPSTDRSIHWNERKTCRSWPRINSKRFFTIHTHELLSFSSVVSMVLPNPEIALPLQNPT